jgi:RND family efflux transporter MFP subunit
MKLKLNRKTILIIIAVVLIGFLVWQAFIKKEKPKFSLIGVIRGTITQEVSESGTVEKGDQINLGFKNSGTIENIYVKVGDIVEAGQRLINLETSQLQIQLQEAEANLLIYQAKLDKLLAGSSAEEIQLSETVLANAYQDAKNYIESSNVSAQDAFLVVNSIHRTYFTGTDYFASEGLRVKDNKAEINKAKNEIASLVEEIQSSPTNEKIDQGLSATEDNLGIIIDALLDVQEIIDKDPDYRDIVSSTDKTSLDTQISNINTAKTNIVSAEGTVKEAKDELAIETASPRQEDIDLYQAQVAQAKAEVDLLEEQISDSLLRSPINGTITKINKRIGETVQSALADAVISLLPLNPFQIKVDIYEEDIVKVKVEDGVEIKLTAFPTQVFSGKVISIDPAEKLIEGVVYYEVKIDFQNPPQDLKPGMTADITIKTAQKDNVLIIPETSIQESNDTAMVQVLNGENLEEREIEIGLEGNNGMIEVVAGLNEGEKVIIPE